MKKSSILIFIVFVVLILIFTTGSLNTATSAIVSGANQGIVKPQPPSNPHANLVPTPTESQRDKNIRIANQVVANYHATHTFSSNDYFVCIDMANEVWDMLKNQGINAKILIGRVDYAPTNIIDSNHAWVLAEVSPDQYLALETTGGYSVQKSTNPLYYHGWAFFDPKESKNYDRLDQELIDDLQQYNAAVADYIRYVNQYNQAGFLTRLSMRSTLASKQSLVQQRLQDCNQRLIQINALISSI
jgi:hypothetical protein